MKIGITFPQTEIGADPDVIAGFARATEESGFSFLMPYDHVIGADVSTRTDWRGPYTSETPFHEVFVLLGFLAAITNLELVPGVLVLPQRQTVLVAKQAAEIDVLTGGKFRLGVGIGWNEVEYQALGMGFRDRARRYEEQIEVLRLLWTRDIVTFKGRTTRSTRPASCRARCSGRSRSGWVAARRLPSSSASGGSPTAGSRTPGRVSSSTNASPRFEPPPSAPVATRRTSASSSPPRC